MLDEKELKEWLGREENLGKHQPQEKIDLFVEALCKSTYVTICGPPKSGKSLSTHFLRWYLLEKGYQVTTFVMTTMSIVMELQKVPEDHYHIIIVEDIDNIEQCVKSIKNIVDGSPNLNTFVIFTCTVLSPWIESNPPGIIVNYH